jgi:hypothetical protein
MNCPDESVVPNSPCSISGALGIQPTLRRQGAVRFIKTRTFLSAPRSSPKAESERRNGLMWSAAQRPMSGTKQFKTAVTSCSGPDLWLARTDLSGVPQGGWDNGQSWSRRGPFNEDPQFSDRTVRDGKPIVAPEYSARGRSL